jgi:hypothetical protein
VSGDINRKLGITVEAKDLASGKLSNVKRELVGIGNQAGLSGGAWGRFVGGVESGAGRMKTAIAGAVSHAKMRLSSLASSATTLLGVGGIFGSFAIIGKSIQEAATFGSNVALVSRVTGLAVPVASAMVDTLDKWGVSSDRLLPLLGRLEKSIGAIAATKGGLKAFKDEFGVSLTAGGKLLDANRLLLKSADYFNSNATASQKATFLSKLYGKQWQDLIPILSKGSAFIRAQEKDSIKLTQQQLDNITKYRASAREFQDTVGDVEVKIGANLMPLLTKGMQAASGWLDAHGDEVAGFFKGAAETAGIAAGGAIDLFNAVKAGWETIPAPLRELLIKGFAADRAIKFLFGFSPASLVVKMGAEVAGGVAGAVGKAVAGGLIGAGIGKAFVQPVFVTNPGFGGAGGIPGAAAAAGGLSFGALAAGAAFGAAPFGLAALQDQYDPTAKAKTTFFGQDLRLLPIVGPIVTELTVIQKALADRDVATATAKTNTILGTMAQTEQRHGEQSGGKLDIIAAKTNTTINALERNRAAINEKGEIIRASVTGLSPDLVDIRNAVLSMADRIRIGAAQAASIRDRYYNEAPASSTPATRIQVTDAYETGSTTRHARGMFGLTRGATPLGYAGEAGTEAVAVIRNPRPFGLENAIGHANEHAIDRLEANLARIAAHMASMLQNPQPVYAVASARDFEAANGRRGSHGSRARQIGW